jgi:microcin C transport system substrate-binding protein
MRHIFVALVLLGASAQGVSTAFADEPKPMQGIAIYGEPKYKPGFTHFDYVNPDAPKGGELRQAVIGTFDSVNPFIIKGNAAGEAALPFETLLTQSFDEPFSQYGLIAASIELAPDRSWEIFNLRPEARFHDKSPITADDVVFSFDILKEKGAPQYRFYYAAVSKAEALDPHRVKFTFTTQSRELPLIVGQLPVLSKAYYATHKFEETTFDPPLGSGPYKIVSVDAPHSITLERVKDYWGANLPVNRGLYNFDRLRFDYYRDSTVAIQALKAGAYDLRNENIAKEWATSYKPEDVPAVKDGHLILRRFANKRPTGMQAFAYNLRRPLFQNDKVRAALAYAFDFEWTNAKLFFGEYKRTQSFFSNSELASSGLPGPDELKLLEPLRSQIPPEVFTQTYAAPKTDGSGNIRDNLRIAIGLLKDAGWTLKDGKMVNAAGQQMSFEFLLNEPSYERITLPFVENLKKLGIDARVRTIDSAQYKYRIDHFDFDIIWGGWGQSESPGNEQREQWGSAAADEPGSQNVVGIKNPAVDSLVATLVGASDRATLVSACRALDRVLLWNHYVIPNWYLDNDRLVFWDKFGIPDTIPYQGVQIWAWWVDPAKAAKIAPFLKN